MPIRIVCEKRHHLGESDYFHPAMFCDCCGKQIKGAGANYMWVHDVNCKDHYSEQCDILFFCGGFDCCRDWEEKVRATGNYTSYQKSGNFVEWLGRSMGLGTTNIPKVQKLLDAEQYEDLEKTLKKLTA